MPSPSLRNLLEELSVDFRSALFVAFVLVFSVVVGASAIGQGDLILGAGVVIMAGVLFTSKAVDLLYGSQAMQGQPVLRWLSWSWWVLAPALFFLLGWRVQAW